MEVVDKMKNMENLHSQFSIQYSLNFSFLAELITDGFSTFHAGVYYAIQ